MTDCPHIDPDYADIGLLRAGASLEDHEEKCMSICRATLTVCTTTDDVVAHTPHEAGCRMPHYHASHIPDGMATVRAGDRLMRLDVTTLTCDGCVDTPVGAYQQHRSRGVMWHDGIEGAASHADNTPPADDEIPPHEVVTFQSPLVGPKAGCPECPAAFGDPGQYRQHYREAHMVTPPADVCGHVTDGTACMQDVGHEGSHDGQADVCPDCEGVGDVAVNFGLHSTGLPDIQPCPSCGGSGDPPVVQCGACWGDYGDHDPRCERHPRNINRDRPATVKPDSPEGDDFRVDRPAVTEGTVLERASDGRRITVTDVHPDSVGGEGEDEYGVLFAAASLSNIGPDKPWRVVEADRPAVTERRIRRIRETVEGKGAWKHFTAEARLMHIAGLLNTEYAPAEKLPGWEPPAVTDEQVTALIQALWPDGTENAPVQSREAVRAALEAAAAAARQEQQ